MMLTAEDSLGDGQWLVRQGGVGTELVLRQLLGKDVSEPLCPRERLPQTGSLSRDGSAAARRAPGLAERRELKLARLKQIMQRSLSESDSDGYPPDEGKNQAAAATANTHRPDRPSHLPITEEEPISNHLNLMMRKHLPSSASASTAERKLAFSLSGSKSVDSIGYNPSPTSSDPEAVDGRAADASLDYHDSQKVATSPKSALKSPSSRRKTSQNLKLRVTFDEQVKSSVPEAATAAAAVVEQTKEAKGHHGKERTPTGNSECKRPFGALRSIMGSLSGNTNHNNNNSGGVQLAGQNSPGRKSEGKNSVGLGGGAKGRSKSSNV